MRRLRFFSRFAKMDTSFLSPWKIFVRSSLVCLLLGVVFFGLSLRRIDPLPLSAKKVKFDGDRAHAYMTGLAKGFPNRLPWNENHDKAAEWLKSEFAAMGYEPQEMVFSAVIDGRQYTNLKNIYAERRGRKNPEEIVLVLAHWDITDTTIEGAMDDASGVGVVLELARIFAKEKPDRTLIFLATDSEEFGPFWGARAFARSFGRSHQIVAAASFDFVAPDNQVAILTLTDGLKSGYTPLWVRELALNSLRATGGVEVRDMMNLAEFAIRAIQVPPADHGALLAAGIPAFNWVGQNDNFTHQMSYYHHTANDRTEIMRPESFAVYGKAAEKFVRSVDELSRIPEDFRSSSYWKVSATHFMAGWGVTILHILAFVPFLLYSVAKFGSTLRNRPWSRIRRVVGNEAKNMGIVLGSLLIGYVVLRLLPLLKVITQYEVYPATQKSALLYHPNFLAILLVIAAVGLVYWVFRKTFHEPDDSVGYLEIRQAVHGIGMTAIITLAFLGNSYLAVFLLLPPAYLWAFMKVGRKRGDRLINLALLIGGCVTLLATAVALGAIYHVGVFYWYLFLSAAYGLISVYTAVLFFMALTIMIRGFRKFVM